MRVTRTRMVMAAVLLCALAFVGWRKYETHELENRLGAIASEIAHRPVHVHCQGAVGAALDVTDEAGTVWFDAAGNPADSTDLKHDICARLARYPDVHTSARLRVRLAGTVCPLDTIKTLHALHTLAHESWHLDGIEVRVDRRVLRHPDDGARRRAARRVARGSGSVGPRRRDPDLPADAERLRDERLPRRRPARPAPPLAGLALAQLHRCRRRASVQCGLCATSHGWPSGSRKTPEYPPQKVAAPGRPIVAPAASASASTASTSAGERTLCASVTPPQPPVSVTAESSASCSRPHRAKIVPPALKKTTSSSGRRRSASRAPRRSAASAPGRGRRA